MSGKRSDDPKLMKYQNPLSRLLKPCYVFAPKTLARRVLRKFRPGLGGKSKVGLPWGGEIEVDIQETIGQQIYRQGVFDLAASECIWRLLDPGDSVLDVGANLGYFTSLMSAKVGEQGVVHAFEPHPVIHRLLERNRALAQSLPGCARIALYELALSNFIGSASMVQPAGWDANHGTAALQTGGGESASGLGRVMHETRVETLDGLFRSESFALAKIDVEGHERGVLAGAGDLLKSGRIRHIVYEDHELGAGGIPGLLEHSGYRVFSIGYSLWGLVIRPIGEPVALDLSWESPNFLATLDEKKAKARLGRGWKLLRNDRSYPRTD